MIIIGNFDGGDMLNNPIFWNVPHVITDIDLSKLTYLIDNAWDVNSDSDVTLRGWNWDYDTFAHLPAVVTACHAVGTKVLPAFYHNGTAMHTILANTTLRNQLVVNLVSLVTDNNADGIYLNWEPLGGILSGDVTNFDIFLADLYAVLHPLGKVIASSAGIPVSSNAQFSPSSMQYLEFLDFQTYHCWVKDTAAWNTCMQYLIDYEAAGYDHTKFVLNLTAWAIDGTYSGWGASYSDVMLTLDPDSSVYAYTDPTIDSSFYGAGYVIPGGFLFFQNKDLAIHMTDRVQALGYKGMYIWAINNDLLSSNPKSLINGIYNRKLFYENTTNLANRLFGSTG
jgi:hypothetical protein